MSKVFFLFEWTVLVIWLRKFFFSWKIVDLSGYFIKCWPCSIINNMGYSVTIHFAFLTALHCYTCIVTNTKAKIHTRYIYSNSFELLFNIPQFFKCYLLYCENTLINLYYLRTRVIYILHSHVSCYSQATNDNKMLGRVRLNLVL